jgi:hypothetical protein
MHKQEVLWVRVMGWNIIKCTQLTGGVAGSICSENFTSQLSEIFNNIAA